MFTLLVFGLLIFGVESVSGATYYSRVATGNWNGSVWSTTANGAATTVTITSSDDVIIQTGNVITINTAGAVCKTLTMNAPATANGITITSPGTLVVSGAITMNAPSANNVASTIGVGTGTLTAASITMANTAGDTRDCTVSVSTGSINISGNIAMNGAPARNQIVFTGAGTLNIGGTISGGTISNAVGGYTALTRGMVNFNGAGAQTIPNTTYNFYDIAVGNTNASGASFAGNVTATNIINNITVTNGGYLNNTANLTITRAATNAIKVDLGGIFDAGTASINWTSANGIVNINGTLRTANTAGFSGATGTAISSTNAPTITLGANSTIEYDAPTGSQTVTSRTYSNLTMSNTSGTQTAVGALTVNGTLTTTSGGTLNMSTNQLLGTLSAITNGGTIQTQNTTATPIPTGKTWDGTVQYNATSGVQTVVLGTYNNLTMTNTSGTQTAGGALTVNGTLTTTSGGTLNMSTNQLLGTLSAITNGGIIQTQNTTATPVPTGKTWDGTVQYNATSGAQSVVLGTYNNLTMANTSGTQTAGGAITVNGTLTTTSGGTLNMSTNQLLGTLSTITNSGIIQTQNTTATPIPTGKTWSGTVQYNATSGAQIVVQGTYNNLTMANTSGTQTAGGNVTVNGNLTVSAGATLATDIYLITGNVTGTMSVGAGANLLLGRSGYYTANQHLFPSNFTSANISLNATSTVIFQGQSYGFIPALTYGNLTISSGGNQAEDAEGNITVNGNLTVSANSIFRLGWALTTLNVAQQLIVNGELDFVDGTSTDNSWASKTVNVTGNLSGTGIINMTQAIHTFNLNGSNNSITTFNTDANNGTVTYGSIGNQQVFASPNYRNLTISGGGTKTFAGITNINNTFTNNNNVIANLGTSSHTATTYYLGSTLQAVGSWGGNSSSAINKSANFADVTGILNVTSGACTVGYWKGTISTDWNDAGNWCDNVKPTSTTNVTIPASAPYKPIIGIAGGLCNNITIETGSSLTQSAAEAEASNLFVYGNWTNNGTYTCGIGTTTFVGTALQTIGGNNSTFFYNLTIQNTGGVTLNRPTTVTRSLLLISGIINTTTNLLSVTSATVNTANLYGVIMGGSALSYINGPVKWSFPANLASGSVYKFPVGNTTYLPYTLVNPTTGGTAPTVQVQAFNADPVSGTLNGLAAISSTEYWKLTTTNGFSNTQVTLGKGDVAVNPYNVIAESPGLGSATTYTSIAGTPGFYDVSNSNVTSNRNYYFTLGRTNTPTINISPVVLGGFGYVLNFGPSAEQTFTINGTSLQANIVIMAPTGYEISKTIGIGFGQTITLEKDGSSSVNNVTLYIRLKAGLTVGTYNGNFINITSTGAISKTIECNGTVFATTPSIITSGGRNCDGTAIELGSSSDDINILYWTGPNNYYSQVQNPTIPAPLNANMYGTYTVTGSLPTGANLIVNGTFENGNVGFLSSYRYTSVADWHQGIYGILQNASDLNTTAGAFAGYGLLDNNNTTHYQMVVDGATTANVTVWSQTVKVVPNSTYQFTYWLRNIKNTTDNNPSIIQLYANNQAAGTAFTAPATVADGYVQYYYNWDSGSNTSVTLDLRNQNTISGGNDFALDNIDFRTVTQVSSSVKVMDDNVPLVSISTASTTVQSGSNVVFSATPTNGGDIPTYVWKVTNTGGTTVSYPSTNNSTFNYTPVTGDVISCVMTSNKSCAVPLTATSNNITMTVTGVNNYWIGTNSTVWNDPANWTKKAVPGSGDNVEFATTDNNGTAAQKDLYVDYNRIVGNLINYKSGKNLVIPADKEVKVNNSITLTPVDAASTYDQIQIKCDPNPIDASRLANGSLIFPNATGVNGTVEMYSKSYINSGATDDNQKYFWQYFGIPVETITAEPTLYGAYVRKSNESGIDDDSNYYWTELTNSSTLNAFDGFEICQPVATTYTFKGQLVNRSLNRPSLPYTTGAFYPGEHLLANPYTAAINVNKMNFGTNVEAAVYLYNTGSYGQWSTATDFGNDPGQYQSIPKIPAGNNGLPQEVPSMSSMLIKVYPNNTGVSFNYSDVIKKNESIQRVKSIDAISNTDLISTRIDLTGQHYSDRMWIFTEPSCTRNFDNGWDGRKMLGSSLAPQIFAIEPDGDYQVNSVSDMHNTDLAFQAGDEVEYTLKFTHENIQRQYAGVYLVDLVENKTVDVTQSGSTYTFATAQSDAPAKRFKILTRSYEKGAPDKETQVKIFTAPGRVFVHNLSTFKGECTLYDIAGRAIKIAPFEANAVTEVLNNLTPGAYVVNTITNGEKVSKRVIVQ